MVLLGPQPALQLGPPPPGTRQNRQNLVVAIWSVTWAAAGSEVLEATAASRGLRWNRTRGRPPSKQHPHPGRGHRGVVWAGDYFTMRR